MLATPTLNDASNSGTNTDNVTNQTDLTFAVGTAQPNAAVTVTATLVGSSQMTEETFTADGSGNYTAELTLSEGVWNVTAIQTVNGEISVPSDALEITIDTTAPGIMSEIDSVTLILGDTATVSDVSQYFIDDSTIFSYAGSSDDLDIATAEVTSTDLMITGVSVGRAVVEIAATDLAANETTRTTAVTVIPPSLRPDLDAADDTGSMDDDNITNQTEDLTFSVDDVQPNATVTAIATLVGSSTQMTEATFTDEGGGRYTVELALSEGVWDVIAIQTVAGIPSTSTDANILRVTVDTTAPSFVGGSPTDISDLGTRSRDGYHNEDDNSFRLCRSRASNYRLGDG